MKPEKTDPLARQKRYYRKNKRAINAKKAKQSNEFCKLGRRAAKLGFAISDGELTQNGQKIILKINEKKDLTYSIAYAILIVKRKRISP